MKKIKLLAIFFLLSIGITYAQHLKKDGTPDRRYKENRNYTPSSNSSTSTPTSNSPESITNTNTTEQTSSNDNSGSTYVQCSGTTKKGARCKRMTKSPKGLCFQHGGK